MKQAWMLLLALGLALPSAVRGASVREIEFESGGVSLKGYLTGAEGGRSGALVVYLYGNPGGPATDPHAFVDPLTALRLDVLRFNYRGTWGNDGEFNLTHSIGDLRALLDALTAAGAEERLGVDTSRIFLVAVSFGTAVALVGGAGDPRVEGIVSLVPCDHGYFGGEFADPDSPVRRQLEPLVAQIFGEGHPIEQDSAIFIDDLIANRDRYGFVERSEALLSQRLLFLGGIDDAICPVESHLLPLYRALSRAGHADMDARIWNTNHDMDGVDPHVIRTAISEWMGPRDGSRPVPRP